jgi:hypothetical protein
VSTVVGTFVAVPRLTGSPVTTITALGTGAGTGEGAPGSTAQIVVPEPPAIAPLHAPSPEAESPSPQPVAPPPRPAAGGPAEVVTPVEATPAPLQTAAPIGTATAIPVPVAPPPPYPTPAPAPVPEPAPCGAQDVDFDITTDKQAYAQGESVVITMTLHNRTSGPCDVPDPHNGCNSGFVVYDAGGRQVWPTGPQPMYPCFLRYTTLAAGGTLDAVFQWDQNEWVCDVKSSSCYQRVAPGEYTVRGHWIGGVEAKATFHLV